METIHNFEMFIFDMDGTLAKSKSEISYEMKIVLDKLLAVKKMAVISGGMFSQFEKQLIQHLDHKHMENLFILPTSGSKLFEFKDNTWKEFFNKSIPQKKRKKIIHIILQAVEELGYKEVHPVGEIIEDRESQITFSALGQHAPIEAKEKWDGDQFKRKRIIEKIKPLLEKEFAITLGGTTSIDITLKGIDKAFGIEKLSLRTGIPIAKMLFLGDKLQEGGNDFPVKKTGIQTFEVRDENHTKELLEKWLG
jgi:phosphomannomutase